MIHFRSIKTPLLLTVTTLMTTLIISLSLIHYVQTRNRLMDQLKQEANLLTTRFYNKIRQELPEKITHNNHLKLYLKVAVSSRGLLMFPEMLDTVPHLNQIYFTTNQGEIIYRSARQNAQKLNGETLNLIRHHDPALFKRSGEVIIFIPFIYQGINTGGTLLFYDISHLQHEQDRIFNTALIFLLIFLLLGISGIWLISNKLLSPITMLADHFQKVSSGDHNSDFQPPKNRRDELGSLTNSFLKMDTHIQKQITLLNDEIEQRKQKEEQLQRIQKMEMIGNLSGGLAHDFNNALVGVIGGVELLEATLQEEHLKQREDIDQFINMINLASENAVNIVKQLMTLSRKKNITYSAINLNKAVKHILDICKHSFPKELHIEAIFSPEPLIIEGDFTQIEQVLLNLAINASHAMTIMHHNSESYGGTLQLHLSKLHPDDPLFQKYSSLERTQSYVKLMIQDSGVGIPEEIQKKIFDPFFTTKKESQGTGLGLSMVYSIIEQHHGVIDLQSQPGKGSTFSILLPELTGQRETPSKTTTAITRGSGTILVIDDDELIRFTTRSMLQKCGYKTILAASGIEGLKLFSEYEHEIIVVILDMAMPVMNGKKVFQELQKLKPDQPVIFISGISREQRINEVLEMGAAAFLTKPFSFATLSTTISKIISSD